MERVHHLASVVGDGSPSNPKKRNKKKVKGT
jgi:hypothetical protein